MEEELNRIKGNCVNSGIIVTRNLFLRSLGIVYLFAFLSLYFQIQGLWGDEGILPAKILLEKVQENYKEKATFWNFPAMVWLHPYVSWLTQLMVKYNLPCGSNVENILYLLCIIGIIFSCGIVLNKSFALNSFGFAVTWGIYLNFFIIGQIFMSHQWDMLLLEVGFIAIFYAPICKGNLNIIRPIDDVCYYILRYLMFRFTLSNGIVLINSSCPYWQSFSGLNFYYQSQPFPNYLGYLVHFIPDNIKKIQLALVYFVVLYIPFCFFTIVIRRLRIFAGQLQFCLQIGILLTGTYSFFNLLIMTVNLSNFDDEFLRGILPESLTRWFGLDPLAELLSQVKSDNETKKEKLNVNNNTEDDINASANPDNNEKEIPTKESIKDILSNKKLRNIKDLIDDDSPKLEEAVHSHSNIINEIFLFLNISCVLMMFLMFYFYPLKDLLQGQLRITPEKDLKVIYNQTLLNYYMLFIFLYITYVFGRDVVYSMKIGLFSFFTLYESHENQGYFFSKVFHLCLSLFSFLKNFLFAFLFLLYFLNTVNSFYSGINLTFVDKNLKEESFKVENFLSQGVNLSEFLFSRLHSIHGYSFLKSVTGVNGRPELEIKYMMQTQTKWQTLNFMYKTSNDLDNANLKYFVPHLPRLDMQMWTSAQAKDINTEGWLVVMLGKVLERNPVILDLLGYYVKEKEFYYRNSAFDRMTNSLFGIERHAMEETPKKIKIELFNYRFQRGGNRLFTKTKVKDFLDTIEKYALEHIFKLYGLKEINDKRTVEISSFQLIPVIDIILLIFLVKLLNLIN